MGQKKSPEKQQRILENPYTHGKIADLVAVERQGGTDYVLNWVKTGTTESLDADASLAPPPAPIPYAPFFARPHALAAGLKFSGLMVLGKERLAVINGEAFAAGDQKTIKVRDRSARVRCLEIHEGAVTVEADGRALTLVRGEEQAVP